MPLIPGQEEVMKSYTRNGIEALAIVCKDNNHAVKIYSRRLRKKEINDDVDVDSVTKKKYLRAKASRKKPHKEVITKKNGKIYEIVIRPAGKTALNFMSN